MAQRLFQSTRRECALLNGMKTLLLHLLGVLCPPLNSIVARAQDLKMHDNDTNGFPCEKTSMAKNLKNMIFGKSANKLSLMESPH